MNLKPKSRFIRIAAISGLCATIFYITTIVVLSLSDPRYNQLYNTISTLGMGDGVNHLMFQIAGIITGSMVIIFAIGLHYGIDSGKGNIIGPILIGISGLGLIGLSLFVDPNITYNEFTPPTDPIQIVHLIFASIAITGANWSPFFFRVRFKLSTYWKRFSTATIIIGIMSNIPSFVIFISILTSYLRGFIGLFEKISVFISLIWMAIISINLLRSNLKLRKQNLLTNLT